MELTDARATDASERERFEDDILGVSLELPLGWRYYAAPSKGDRAFSVQILPPEMEAWCLFTAKPGDASERTTRRVAEGDVAILGGYFEEYTVRPDSWVESEQRRYAVGRLRGRSAPTSRFRDKGKDMVEYRVYALGESAVYWFVFRVTQGRFWRVTTRAGCGRGRPASSRWTRGRAGAQADEAGLGDNAAPGTAA